MKSRELPEHLHPKGLLEHLNSQAVHAPDWETRDAMVALARVLNQHRPTGSNGKHGDLHTPTCGCVDK